jgi:ferredoxin-NADP reductase
MGQSDKAMTQAATFTAQLSAIRYGAKDTVLLEFTPMSETSLPLADAGAHIDVHLPSGLIRQYSLITPLTNQDVYVIAVKKDAHSRGGSTWLHEHARVGMQLTLSMPRNNFALRTSDAPVALIAGGIGITPIYSLLAALDNTHRQVHLHYWCKSPQEALFINTLGSRNNVSIYYSNAESTFTIRDLMSTLTVDTEIYCCGPQRMLDELSTVTADRSAPVYVEKFGAVEAVANDAAFTVFLAKSGIEVQVEKGTSILDALKETSADVMYSCEQGVCGACEVNVLDGEPIHRDNVRSEAEHQLKKTMIICCSGCKSDRLVLDI